MIKIIKGNLVRQNTDAIVNPINADIVFAKGIPYFVKKNGGIEVEKEALRFYPANLGKVFVTSGKRLPTKQIIHIVNKEFGMRTSYLVLKKTMDKVFQEVLRLELNSVSIPPIYDKFSPEITANIICDSLVDMIKENPELKEVAIYLVIFDSEAREVFYNVFKDKFSDLVEYIKDKKDYNRNHNYRKNNNNNINDSNKDANEVVANQ